MGFLSNYDSLKDPQAQVALLQEWIVQNPDAMLTSSALSGLFSSRPA